MYSCRSSERKELLGAILIAGPLRYRPAFSTIRPLLGQSASGSATLPGQMIVYSEEYVTREMPVSLLDSWITPVEHFFVRNNELMLSVNPSAWRLRVTGEVIHPLEFDLQEIARLEPRHVTSALECAGNGRAFFRPHITGVPWSRGGVGNTVFSGPPMEALLRRAGVKSTARHVAFRGLAAPAKNAVPFVRSIPLGKAMDANTLVATGMNGAPLSLEHGYPARALVPGWIGSASIKWLTEINVTTHEFRGYYMDSAYRSPTRPIRRGDSFANVPTTVLTSLRVKSIIAQPADGTDLSTDASAPVRIFGAAWAGESAIQSVDVSTHGGTAWKPASLGPEHARYAWRLWNFEWTPPRPGRYLLMSRARDTDGRSQPLETPWNPGGYLWNAADRVGVNVRAAYR